MKALLDSHAFYWAIVEDPRLSRAARAAILEADNEILVSTASYYELTFKAHRKRLDGQAPDLAKAVSRSGFAEIDVKKAHLLAAATLDWTHGDPWDRIFAAQSILERCVLISADAAFDRVGVQRLW